MLRFGIGIDKKLDQLATTIDEATAPAPLDLLDAVSAPASREETMWDEVRTSLDEMKVIAQDLMQQNTPESVNLSRRLMVCRQSFKLLARTTYGRK